MSENIPELKIMKIFWKINQNKITEGNRCEDFNLHFLCLIKYEIQ